MAGDVSWTYNQVGQRIATACRLFRGSGVGSGLKVAIIAQNSPGYVIAYFAAQFLGAVTVEIARHEGLNTLLEIIRKTKPSLVLTDREDLLEELSGNTAAWSVRTFKENIERDAGAVSLPEPEAVDKDAPASILYTSGTTGLPKGVILSHRNFCSVVTAILDYLKLRPEDRYALVLPLYHSYGKSNLLTSFAVGASVVFLDNFMDLHAFLTLLSSLKCTVFSGVPYHGNIMVKRGVLARYDLSCLRAVTFSGNDLPRSTVEMLRSALPHVDVFPMYGLTESTTRACYVPPDRVCEKPGSCGKPIHCVKIRIVGEDGSVLASGMSGNVELQGPNIMLGYFGEPELTAETLKDGWLRTGDIGWLDEEGYLYLKGRTKDIIKCAGERISPEEIEMVLRSHPEVEEAAVVGISDPVLGEAVKAFIVPVRAGSCDTSALRTLCARSLSHHKIPRSFEFVENLPKTPTGKIKKHLLRGD